MKKITRILSLVVALALVVMSVSVTAVADDTVTLTVNDSTSNKTYSAYQIFDGDVSTSDSTSTLSNITWGAAITDSGSDLLTTLLDSSNSYYSYYSSYVSSLSTSSSATDLANALDSISDDSSALNAIAKVLVSYFTSSSYTTGATATLSYDSTNLNYSASVDPGYYIVIDTTDDSDDIYTAMITITTSTAIDPKTESTDGTVTKTADVDSAAYGATVTYTVEFTLPTDLASYNTYTLNLADTLTNLTYTTDSLSVAVVYEANSETTSEAIENVFTASATTDSTDSTKQNLTITGTLDNTFTQTSAYAGATIVFTYKATVSTLSDFDYDGATNSVTATYSNDPTTSSTSTTDESNVTVYNYQLTISKVDSKNNPLTGAGFTLYKLNESTGEWTAEGSELTGADMSTFTWSGLADGYYKLEETTTPGGYSTADPVYFQISTDTSSTNGISTVTQYASITYDNGTVSTTSYSGDGLTTDNVNTNGVISGTITNYAGNTLPSTGGMGTKIFYSLGGILVVGAGVLLIVKRRMRTA